MKVLPSELWRGRRVFVTGHTGFKGSWLSIWLELLGAEVVGYALEPPTTPSLFALAGCDRRMQSTIADIRDFDRLTKAIAEAQPEIVFHMAAQSRVLKGYEDPLETYSTNVLGTVNVLEAIRRLELTCAVINVTSDKAYLNVRQRRAYRESDILGGRDPYSSSKACAELVSRAYRDSYFECQMPAASVGLANARAGNVIGGGDWTAGQLVPDAIRAFDAGVPVVLRRPEAVRPWQHVLDCLRGYLLLAEALHLERGRFTSDWNFGPEAWEETTVAELVDLLAELWGNGASWERDPELHAPEEVELRLDSNKAASMLGWRAVVPLRPVLASIVDWHRELAAGAPALELCHAQIRTHQAWLAGERGAAQ